MTGVQGLHMEGQDVSLGHPARVTQALLDCLVAITSSNLDAHLVLSRLLTAACEVTGADDRASQIAPSTKILPVGVRAVRAATIWRSPVARGSDRP